MQRTIFFGLALVQVAISSAAGIEGARWNPFSTTLIVAVLAFIGYLAIKEAE